MDRTKPTSVAFIAGRVLSRVVLLVLLAAATYASVIAYVNWSSIGV